MLKLVVFDCDGTLYNSVGGVQQGLTEAFAHHGFPSPKVNDLPRLLARPFPDVVAYLLNIPSQDSKVDSVIDTYYHYMENKNTGDLYDGVIPMLQTLQRHGYLMAMVTGMGGRGVMNLFDTYSLGHYFDSVKHADNGARKPDPQSLFECIDELGVAGVQDVIMIGDTVTDMHYAGHAKCASIGVSWGAEKPEILLKNGKASAIAHHMSDIVPLVEQHIGKPL